MVYYLEDDTNIRELVLYTLGKSGLEAQGFAESGAFFEAMEKALPELILLDIMLPGEDGLAVLARLRKAAHTAEIPIVMITARGTEYDKVIGLDAGADDYIVKPFGMMELVARVNARLRRTAPPGGNRDIEVGPLRINPQKHMVWVEGEAVTLTHKEFALMLFLLENRGLVFDRERLLEALWGYDYLGGTRTVDVHIQTLRQKLMECGKYIETVRGVGYRFKECDA